MFAAILISSVFAAGSGNDPYTMVTDRDAIRSEAIQDLIGELGDPKKGRQAAIRLVRFGKAAVPKLIQALKSPVLQVRFYAASALDLISHPAATEALFHVLENEAEEPAIRRVAVRAMGRSGYVQAVPVLMDILTGKRKADGLSPGPGVAAGEGSGEDTGAPRRLLESSPLATDEEYRFEVIRSLSYIGDDSAADVLAEAAEDASPRIREVAAQGLGDMVAGRSIGRLRALLSDPESRVAAAAARALGKCGALASAAVEDLVGAFEHPDVRVRRNVRGALAIITGQSFSTYGRWQQYLQAMRKERERTAHTGDDAPGATVPSPEAEHDPDGRTPRTPTGATPPALRPPWEWEEPRSQEEPANSSADTHVGD
jgi:HEAT repeat protein